MKKRTVMMLTLLVFALLAGGCRKDSGGKTAGVIPWDKAAGHMGDYATVEGRVVDTHYAASSKGSPTFLNVGKPYPDKDRFTVVIWGRNRAEFDGSPERTYRGKLIRVSGTISSYKGSTQIEAESPDQIEIVE